MELSLRGGTTRHREPDACDDKIRQLKIAIRERAERDHIQGLTEGSNQGWHREGSARGFVAGSAPTAYDDPDATAVGGDSAVDLGRVWFDSTNAYLPKVYDGGWQPFLRELARASIQGSLTTLTNALSPMVFPRAGTISKISAAVGTPPVGSSIIMDVNKGGSTIFGSAGGRLTIADGDSVGNTTDITAAMTADGYLTFDIDQVGSSTPGADIGVTVEVILS